VDAKLQIWDLSVSALDPVVTLDIGSEDLKETILQDTEGLEGGIPRSPSDLHSLPSSPSNTLGNSRYDRLDANSKDANANATPCLKLMKNLAVEPKKRILTTVLFGENNPIVVVGDNRGQVNVYRVFDPFTITNLGPLQQFLKLKEVIVRQTDPNNVSILESDTGYFSSSTAVAVPGGVSSSNASNNSNVAESNNNITM
jgi:hypothetical protein